MLYKEISDFLSELQPEKMTTERKKELQVLIDFIQEKIDTKKEVNLNFICTHNSRRSQFAQIWAKVASHYYQINVNCFSGGVEITAFNERAVKTIKNTGFKIEFKPSNNPEYQIGYSDNENPIISFSKLYDDLENPTSNFAAVMTCSHADENCPFISGTEKRISIRYDDPKEFDDTPQETEMYNKRSKEIATEMIYIFSKIK